MKNQSGGESIIKSGTKELVKPTELTKEFHFRKPTKDDGAAVWELVKHTGVLDLNSSYSYLMWCEIFSETSIVVEKQGDIVGFISGFIHPKTPDSLFIWQVAVHESVRGNGLGTRMLFQLLEREYCTDVRYVEATVSPSNIPSQHLFLGLAKKLDTKYSISNYFVSIDFPRTGHENELLYKIGPFEEKKLMKRMM
ncbi:diaminobutyrate acetyltransferase [Lentibacillus populi]|uniref:L-2,4-diaminobutyric acid acetyltransferase n=1 Tax=Lentibacillus populi TaxID=1827502 RepID=A0A9W5X772_9BACI|nr:diaminobutyrate acetyltransferase [Lentibacillus populi]